MKLSENINKKFIDSIQSSEWEVETDSGWEDISHINKTIEYEIYQITLEDGKTIKCADTHIFIDENDEEIYALNSVGVKLKTKSGSSRVISCDKLDDSVHMYDLTVNSKSHTYYTNDILSHNTTTVAAYIVWYMIFNDSKTIAILANKAAGAREVMSRVQDIYQELPIWMQQGVRSWNKGSVELENGSKAFTAATSANACRGYSVSLLYLDEAAIVANNIAEDFFTSAYPTISSGTDTKVIMTSTPMGLNHFWSRWRAAEEGLNGFVTVSAHYTEHPDRDQKWADEQLAILGELKFAQEVLAEFSGSSSTLLSSQCINRLVQVKPIFTSEGLDVLEQPKKGHTYVMVIDTSKGGGGDYSAFVVIDITELPYTVVAKYRNNKISPMLYPNVIYKIAKEYNEAYMLIEINSSEQVPYILHNEFEYENMLRVYKGRNGQTIGFGGGSSSKLGVHTDKKVKRLGCSTLKSMMERNQIIVSDEHIIQEFSVFIEKKGSFSADVGYHDDLVMCLVLFAWLTTNEFFKDLSNADIRIAMYEQQMKDIESNLTPIGFFNDGREDNPIQHF